jgi:NADH dehydrogenase
VDAPDRPPHRRGDSPDFGERLNVVVIGSGFAGLWAALGAARRVDELAVPYDAVNVTVLSAKPFHDIRVRNYEADLSDCRIPLADVLDPVGTAHIAAEVTAIDTDARTVATSRDTTYRYDRLVLASGSHVVKPDIPGLLEYGFDVDTYDGAVALEHHLRGLADSPATLAAATAVVAGAGLTGIEVRVTAVSQQGVSLSSGERVVAATLVWCAGMRASSLTAQLPVARDRLGRVPVDDYLRVDGVPSVFAAGDVAAARMDEEHLSVMSCQHGRPMGRYAGYNVVSDLFGEPMLALRIPWYVTVLDLGPAGAVYTEGWNREVVACGAEAKATKKTINTRRIYPPLTRDRAALLAAAAPDLQERPKLGH